MKTWKVLLVDFGLEHKWGKQICELLAASDEPQFEFEFQGEDEHHLRVAASRLSDHAARFCPALMFLIFDRVPEADALGELLETLRGRSRRWLCIVVAPAESSKEVMEIFHQGAEDVWVPPLRAVEALARVEHWLEQLPPKEDEAPQKLRVRLGVDQFVGDSPALLAEIAKMPVIANCSANVLIRGETGTGKDICARAIHYLSPRTDKPFLPVNCGALPLELIENELFGHETGAFTSANGAAKGLIEQADGGTLFLDEIDALPLGAQVKLLRFLQDHQYRPLGSQTVRTGDVRLIAATNADLDQMVRLGRFRQDLLFRLNVLELTLPPLRERGEDTELLARHFLGRYATVFGKAASGFTTEALRKLNFYAWPGNVRELENTVERAVALSQHSIIQGADILLPNRRLSGAGATFKDLKADTIQSFELKYLSDALRCHHGNVSKAARAAGKERRTFWQLLRKHGLTAARSLPPAA